MSKKKISQSFLKSRVHCSNIEFLYEKEGAIIPLAFEKGTILHEMLENTSKDGTIGAYSVEYSEYRGKRSEYTYNHNFKEFETIVKDFYIKNKELFQKGETEVYLETELSDFLLTGTVDRIIKETKTHTHLIDWKSGNASMWIVKPNSKSNYIDNILETIQATVYSLLYFQNNKEVETITFTWHYIEMNEKVSLNFTRENIPIMKAEIVMLKVLTERVGFNVTYKCKQCSKALNCPFLKTLGKVSSDFTVFTEEELYKKKQKIDIMLNVLTGMKASIKTLLQDKVKDEDVKKYFTPTTKNYVKINNKVPRELLLDLLKKDEIPISQKDLINIQLKYKDIEIIKKENVNWKRAKKVKTIKKES